LRSAAVSEFCEMLSTLGVAQNHVARLFGVGPRSVRRWQSGARRVPLGVSIIFRLLAAKAITLAQVETVAILTRTNGGGPPAPLRSDANPTLTIGEKVLALTPEVCHWPCGDPRHPDDFHFCGSPAVRRPYCDHHRRMAYIKPANPSTVTAPLHLPDSVLRDATLRGRARSSC
jgi:GcrA cell cycle regulator